MTVTRRYFVLSFILFILAAIIALVSGQQYKLQIWPNDNPLKKASNRPLVLTCLGSGGDAALFSQLKWFTPQNEEITNESLNPEIKSNFKINFYEDKLLLNFLKPKSELSGTYTCRGLLQNSESLSNTIQVNIYEDVTWDQCPEMQYLIKGNSGERINCKASANPKPNIIWSKGSESLNNNPRYLINSTGIVVKGPVTENDGGVFQINAMVLQTGNTYEKRITVQIYSRPQIITTTDIVSGIEDDQVEMKCESLGVPKPLYSWFDHNRRNLSTVGGYAVDRITGSLIISRLKKLVDEGNFTCLAENSAGKSEKSTKLLVYIRPKISRFFNNSYEQNKESYIECRATGEPRPKLTLRKDGMTRPFQLGDPRIKLDERTEKIEQILKMTYTQTTRKDGGLYYCRAENNAGFNEMVGYLEVKYSPDMSLTPLRKEKTWDNRPVNISCIADAIPNATIKWYKNGYEILPNDIYRISDSGSGSSRLFIIPTKLTYDNQVFGTYRCEGINSLGKGYIDIDLERATVPGHVTNVRQISITPTQVRFLVGADLYNGGMVIKKIYVEYFNAQDPADRNIKEFPYSPNFENPIIIDNLRPSTFYTFRFSAENEVGKGEYGPESRILTKQEDAPDKPEFHNLNWDSISKSEVIAQSPTKFTATWNMPSNNGRKIKHFGIKYYPVKKTEFGFIPLSDANKEFKSQISDEATTITLTQLKPNSYYRLELVANNELGDSPPAMIVFRTQPASDMPDEDEDTFSPLRAADVPMGLIAGAVIVVIIILLLFMDIFFYCRYKVGAIYFLRTHICNVGQDDESKLNNFSPALTPTEISERERFGYRSDHDSAV
ncbi:Ncam2p [Tyrophagus putrescentiae]|nr:Ncam2p [Tyrophagus putrescentiae]